MQHLLRTTDLGALRKENENERVTLSGWVHRFRDHGGLIFIDLRDRFGLTQLVFDPEKQGAAHKIAESLRSEWVIQIEGIVSLRAPGMNNPKLSTGDIEVLVDKIEVFSKAKTPPFLIAEEGPGSSEEIRLKYRYLDMRKGTIAENLVVRHKTMLATRNFLSERGFLEISTPILGKSTPEGARDYLVPSRVQPGNFYALPQSPQLFKQLLMIGGMDRYFQIATCFRDEDLRADRQPEFTQIDIEISFGKQEAIFEIIEGLVSYVFKEVIGKEIPTPFQKMPYHEAEESYGTDRPDLRFGMKLKTIDELAKKSSFSVFLDALGNGSTIRGIAVPGGAAFSRRNIDDYGIFAGQLGARGLAWMKMQDGKLQSNIVKFFSEDLQKELIEKMEASEGDLLLFVADQRAKAGQILDHLRRKIAKDLNLIPEGSLAFVWVVDFPLLAWNSDENRLVSEHHPFTAPIKEDMSLLDTEPLKVRSAAYDLVLNGYEIGGGSVRIHSEELQEKIFDILKMDKKERMEKFGFFLNALSYGTPPHLGIALGLDRLIMLLVGTENIRDVIAFPKTQKASDLMLECPSSVADKQLDELSLKMDLKK